MPRARPETTVTPSCPSHVPAPWQSGRRRAGLRAPTIATIGRSSRSNPPLAVSSGGASSSWAKRGWGPWRDQVSRAEPLDRLDLAFEPVSRKTRDLASAASCEIRNGGERRLGGAEAEHQLAVGDRSDARRADEPQPIDQVGRQAHAFLPDPRFLAARQAPRYFRDASRSPVAQSRAASGTGPLPRHCSGQRRAGRSGHAGHRADPHDQQQPHPQGGVNQCCGQESGDISRAGSQRPCRP